MKDQADSLSLCRRATVMENETLRQRHKAVQADSAIGKVGDAVEEHPGGHVKHGGPKQLWRLLLVLTYTFSSCVSYVIIRIPARPR